MMLLRIGRKGPGMIASGAFSIETASPVRHRRAGLLCMH